MSQANQQGPQAIALLEQQVADILAEAKRQGASACEVAVSAQQGLSVGVRQQEVESVEFTKDQGFSISLYLGQRKGNASTSMTGTQAIRETVAAALAIAKHTSADDCAGLGSPEQMAKDLPDLDLWHPWEIEPQQAIELALECEAAAFAADPRISMADGTSLDTDSGCTVYGNSQGFIGGYAATRHSMSCVMIAGQGESMQRSYWYDLARDASQLDSAASIGTEAAKRTVARLGARPVATCQVPVLFSAEVAGGLLGHLLGAISGGNLYRKSSFLLDSLGQQIFPDWFNLDERPQLRGGLASSAFDGDGLATYDKHLVQDGELRSYLLSLYSGRKLGLPSTANAGGARNLFVSHGNLDQAQLIKQMGRGLLVTELMGQGVNLVTGDYSRGAGGYWVENGEIQFPVQEVTIAGNLRDLYRNLVAIGNDLDLRGSIRTGSILLEQMTVAGA